MPDYVTVEGLDELADLLRNQAPKAAKRYLRKVTSKAADVILEALNETVPVDGGELEESLMWKKTRNADPNYIEVNIGPKKGTAWGSMQEFGTKFQPAQHWMGRAWMDSKDAALAVFEAEASIMCDKLRDKDTDDGGDSDVREPAK